MCDQITVDNNIRADYSNPAIKQQRGNEMSELILSGQACLECESSDAMAVYVEHDKALNTTKLNGYCYSCCTHFNHDQVSEEYDATNLVNKNKQRQPINVVEYYERLKNDLPTTGWVDRVIKTATAKYYGVLHAPVSGAVEKQYCPIHNQENELVGVHVRNVVAKNAKNELRHLVNDLIEAGTIPKSYEKMKGRERRVLIDQLVENGQLDEQLVEDSRQAPFYVIGENNNQVKMFGQHLFAAGGKVVVITEGQIDAMSVFQVLENKDNGWVTPVVSLTCGAGGAVEQLKANYAWVTSFDKVVIAFDNDDEGNKAAEAVLRLLKPEQAYRMIFRHKDANDYLVNKESQELKNCFFKAEQFKNSHFRHLASMWDSFSSDENYKISFPPAFSQLNTMMNGGMEFGEITTIGALTSIGKSTIVTACIYHWSRELGIKTGALFLEGSQREVVRDFLSLHLGRNLRKDNDLNYGELRDQFFKFADSTPFVLLDNAGGARDLDSTFDDLEQLIVVEGCKILVIDPLQALIASNDNEKTIYSMDRLLKLAKKYEVAIVLVSHMRKPDSDDAHNVNEYNLLGSSSINQMSFNTILLSRDKLAECPIERNSTQILLPKCRRTGDTGHAGWLRFDASSYQMIAGINPYSQTEKAVLKDEMDLKVLGAPLVEDKPADFKPAALEQLPDDFTPEWI